MGLGDATRACIIALHIQLACERLPLPCPLDCPEGPPSKKGFRPSDRKEHGSGAQSVDQDWAAPGDEVTAASEPLPRV